MLQPTIPAAEKTTTRMTKGQEMKTTPTATDVWKLHKTAQRGGAQAVLSAIRKLATRLHRASSTKSRVYIVGSAALGQSTPIPVRKDSPAETFKGSLWKEIT